MRLAPFLLLLFILASARAAPPSSFPTDEAAATALDAPDFIQREKAARHLWLRGSEALPLLEKLAAGGAESALRARTILESIRLRISPDTPGDLADLIRNFHRSGDPDQRYAVLTGVVANPEGLRLLLAFAAHESASKIPGWEAAVTETASQIYSGHELKGASPVYRELLASLQGEPLPALFHHATGNDIGDIPFAYDLLAYSENPKPGHQDRILKVSGKLQDFYFLPYEPSEASPIHYPRSWEAQIAEAEKLAGDPTQIPAMLEKLLDHSPDQNADALTSALLEQSLLPAWIASYKTKIEAGAPPQIHLALAQFLRASGQHDDAFAAAKNHTRNPTHLATFAILAKDYEAARHADNDPTLRRLVDLIRDAEKTLPLPNTSPALLLESRSYRAFADQALHIRHPLKKLDLARQIARVSPPLAKEIIREISPDSLERIPGAIGQLLATKRLVGEEKPLIDFISARFASVTSDFWDSFMDNYFADESPFWIALLIRTRHPDLSRYEILHRALTLGTEALVPEDLTTVFEEFVGATDAAGSVPPHTLKTAQKIRSLLDQPRFADQRALIRSWADSLPPSDRRPSHLFPNPPANHNPFAPRANDLNFLRKLAITSLSPPPASIIPGARTYLEKGDSSAAIPWLVLAAWLTASESDTSSDSAQITATSHQLLVSALGLEALENGDLPTAQKRFQNLCALGSLDPQLGTALHQNLIASNQQSEAHTLFTTRWNQLEAILEIAPRDAEVCRALATWANACKRLPDEAETYASRAALIESEQANLKTHISRFIW